MEIRSCRVLLLLIVAQAWTALSAHAAFDPAWISDERTAILQGQRLERDLEWRDAIELYEEATEQWPENEHLTYGLRRAKFQFTIQRRYEDLTFHDDLLTLSRADALGLFDQILNNISSYYVEQITTTSVVAHGTENLWLALDNPRFIETHLANVSEETIEAYRRHLRDNYWNRELSYRGAARRMVEELCQSAQSQLGLQPTVVVMEFVFGACNCLDDYSAVLTPGKRQDLFNNIAGEFVGIGIVMEADPGNGMLLVNILPNSPAAEQGLRPGEWIQSIDGVDCREMSTDEGAGLLTGPAGSNVALRVKSPADGGVRMAVCDRRRVEVKSVSVARIIDPDQGVAYIQMNGFSQSTTREMQEALQQLRNQGMRSLIWDLRGNPGGLLSAAVEILDLFIDEGVLVSTRGRLWDQDLTYSAHRLGTLDVPIVLLIDENSASASEIVAGAIRDHQRGTIVGRHSYGKWSVQTIYDTADETGIRLTTARFYSPAGHTYTGVGIVPDLVVELTDEEAAAFRPMGEVDVTGDRDIQTALQALSNTPHFTQR